MTNMTLDVFKDDKDRAEARSALPGFIDHPAWKFIVRAIDANIEVLNEALRTREDFSHLEEVYRLQDRISDLTQYKSLPAALMAELSEEHAGDEDDGVYET